jgi:glucose-1-phosphate thymidylyltransferase
MKGVIICGGSGTRLKPLTEITNKSLLPVYDKPLLLYPLEVLRSAGITEIVIITGPEHMDQMTSFLGTGERFGCTFHFKIQEKPEGIAQALGLAEEFAAGDSVCALLGDNVFFDNLNSAIAGFRNGAHLFLKEVPDPERFGVAEVARQTGEDGAVNCAVISLEEKPKEPKSNCALTGCYLFDSRCFEVIRGLKPSWRNEYEITDLARWYLERGELSASVLTNEWIDAGTFESLYRAGHLVRERRLQSVAETTKEKVVTPTLRKRVRKTTSSRR